MSITERQTQLKTGQGSQQTCLQSSYTNSPSAPEETLTFITPGRSSHRRRHCAPPEAAPEGETLGPHPGGGRDIKGCSPSSGRSPNSKQLPRDQHSRSRAAREATQHRGLHGAGGIPMQPGRRSAPGPITDKRMNRTCDPNHRCYSDNTPG